MASSMDDMMGGGYGRRSGNKNSSAKNKTPIYRDSRGNIRRIQPNYSGSGYESAGGSRYHNRRHYEQYNSPYAAAASMSSGGSHSSGAAAKSSASAAASLGGGGLSVDRTENLPMYPPSSNGSGGVGASSLHSGAAAHNSGAISDDSGSTALDIMRPFGSSSQTIDNETMEIWNKARMQAINGPFNMNYIQSLRQSIVLCFNGTCKTFTTTKATNKKGHSNCVCALDEKLAIHDFFAGKMAVAIPSLPPFEESIAFHSRCNGRMIPLRVKLASYVNDLPFPVGIAWHDGPRFNEMRFGNNPNNIMFVLFPGQHDNVNQYVDVRHELTPKQLVMLTEIDSTDYSKDIVTFDGKRVIRAGSFFFRNLENDAREGKLSITYEEIVRLSREVSHVSGFVSGIPPEDIERTKANLEILRSNLGTSVSVTKGMRFEMIPLSPSGSFTDLTGLSITEEIREHPSLMESFLTKSQNVYAQIEMEYL